MFMNAATFVRSTARLEPSRVAIAEGPEAITYADLDRRSDSVAAALRQAGVGEGDRVGLSLPNSIDFVTAYFGILKAGAVVTPFNVTFKEEEVRHVLTDCGASAVIFDDTAGDRAETVMRAAQAAGCPRLWRRGKAAGDALAVPDFARLLDGPSDPAWLPSTEATHLAAILYTSGTTGTPKGAMITHGNLCFSGLTNARTMAFTADDRILLTLPLFHIFGQAVLMLGGIAAAARLEILPRFEPHEALRAMADGGVTVFGGVPTMYSALLAAADGIDEGLVRQVAGDLRLCLSGAAPLPQDLQSRFEAVFGCDVLDGYGLTEASPTVAFSRAGEMRQPGSVGPPVWGVEVRLVDPAGRDVSGSDRGEIWCRSPGVFAGYWRRPEATAEALQNGWLRTGDVGRFDEAGNLYVVDRLKDIIIRGGYNVYPAEVENLLCQHPDVALCAVVGQPDAHYGEEVVAHVVLRPSSTLKAQELIAWAKARLAGHKYPRRVVFRESMPLTGSGKILKRQL